MEPLIILLIGFSIVAVYDAICSILSRVLKFEYVWFAFGSFIIYGALALILVKHSSLLLGLTATFFVGIFDATIGLLISKYFKAYIKDEDKDLVKITPQLVLYMGVLAVVIGSIAIYFFA